MAAVYLDSSALVKLAVREVGSDALRKHLRRRRPLMSSALARAEVLRALLPGGSLPALPGAKSLAGSTSSVSTTPFSVKPAPCCPSNWGPWLPSTSLQRHGSGRTWPRSSPTTCGWPLPLALWATRSHRLPDHTASGLPAAPEPSAWTVVFRPGAGAATYIRRSWADGGRPNVRAISRCAGAKGAERHAWRQPAQFLIVRG